MKNLLVSLFVIAAPALAQQSRPVAITNARILTMTGAPIERGVVVVRNGKIEAVGADLAIPPGAAVVDAEGGTLMPGLVSAWSRAGVTKASARTSRPQQRRGRGRGRRFGGRQGGGGNSDNHAATKVIDSVYPREKIFGELLHAGVTTLAIAPNGDGLPGLGAILDPSGKDRETLAVREAAFVLIQPGTGTKAKKLLRDSFASAKTAIAAAKRAAERAAAEKAKAKDAEKKEADKKEAAEKGTGGEKPAEKGEKKIGGDQEKKEATPPRTGERPTSGRSRGARGRGGRGGGSRGDRKDPNVDVLAELLQGKRRAFLTLSSAKQVAHYLDAAGDVRFPKTVLVAQRYSGDEGLIDTVLDDVKKLAPAGIILSTDLTTAAYSRVLRNPAADLHAAGIPVAFTIGDTRANVRGVFFRLMELVRHGLPAEAALRGVTATPAALLGTDSVGSIAPGKDADLLLFTHDPLDPVAQLRKIWHKGTELENAQ